MLRDPAHGFVLTLGAGGTLTEVMSDATTLIVPASRDQVRSALSSLRICALIDGYRGRPGADMDAILDAVAAVQAYVIAQSDSLLEVEINPLICTPDAAIAADALIRKGAPA